jgi:tRNA (adenine37-N6)-methyltransferase
MMAELPDPVQLTLSPIGFIRTAHADKVDAPRQPRAAAGVPGRIELLPGRHFEHALEDLAGWEYLWVIFWFDRNASWRPKVLPPRSRSGRKGVFSTRSPHRPNPLGLSALRLDRIEGLTLHVLDVDMLDGTPVLDIKPYVAYTDAIPQARSGWLDDSAMQADAIADGPAPADPVDAWQLRWDTLATAQAEWILARTGLDIRGRADATLALGPAPHPYRRIRPDGDRMQLSVRDWRLAFRVSGREVSVLSIRSGYRDAQLASAAADDTVLSVHREFLALFYSVNTP